MIKLTGIPFDENSSFLKGCSLAPNIIRLVAASGSSNSCAENGLELINGENFQDLGDINLKNFHSDEAFLKIREEVSKLLKNSDKLIFFGGDHSITFPIIDAFIERFEALNILHFDAHPDLYDDFEGNPFSHASPFARIMEKGKVRSLTQVGIRTLNTHQQKQVERFGVKVIEMKEFNDDFISELESPLYISLDLDVLDPAFAPGVSHYEPGGLSTRKVIQIIQNIQAAVVGADIVEYNPKRDFNEMTAMVAYKLFKEIAAKMLVNN